ncbi:LytR C-terminal domain-containing protein [Kutzneria viridogrisea]|uniref:Cytoskeletal protein RodZ n=1 Tax=Kutzneria viridogrisea TaxID=47990 RepID=A0ABR6BW17_9PSEU|nr:cytoskeletal protein RodZ [Kutzneria viridogrisea]
MSSMEPGSPARPARIAGFALLGVAAIALVMGVVSLIVSNNSSSDAAGTTTTPPAATSSAVPAPTSQSSSAPPATTTSAPPPTTTTTQAPPPPPDNGGGQQTPSVPVRVYNNSTIKNLAAKAAEELKQNGWNVTASGNYSQGIIPRTTVYYRPGTDEENAAKVLAQRFQLHVEPRFDGIQAADPGVIVILTNDYQGPPGKS